MTGYTVHTGSTEQFSEGWDRIFGAVGKQKSPAKKPSASTASKKKSATPRDAQPKR